MSDFSFISENTAAFKFQTRYCYHAAAEDEARIEAFTQGKSTQTGKLLGYLHILGQACVAQKNYGVLFPHELNGALRPHVGSIDTGRRIRRALVAAGVLEDLGDGYRLATYLAHNLSPEQWEEKKARRAQYKAEWQRAKRAEQRATEAQKQGSFARGLPPPPMQICHPPALESADTACSFNFLEGDDNHYSSRHSGLGPLDTHVSVPPSDGVDAAAPLTRMNLPRITPAQAAPQGEPSVPSLLTFPPLTLTCPIATKVGGSLSSRSIEKLTGAACAGRASLGVSQKQKRGAHGSADAAPRWGKAKSKPGEAEDDMFSYVMAMAHRLTGKPLQSLTGGR